MRWCPSQKDPIRSPCIYDHGKKMHYGIMEIRSRMNHGEHSSWESRLISKERKKSSRSKGTFSK